LGPFPGQKLGLSHVVPSGPIVAFRHIVWFDKKILAGHVVFTPSQNSVISQGPVAFRHIVPLGCGFGDGHSKWNPSQKELWLQPLAFWHIVPLGFPDVILHTSVTPLNSLQTPTPEEHGKELSWQGLPGALKIIWHVSFPGIHIPLQIHPDSFWHIVPNGLKLMEQFPAPLQKLVNTQLDLFRAIAKCDSESSPSAVRHIVPLRFGFGGGHSAVPLQQDAKVQVVSLAQIVPGARPIQEVSRAKAGTILYVKKMKKRRRRNFIQRIRPYIIFINNHYSYQKNY
jgi:hypothetical protein